MLDSSLCEPEVTRYLGRRLDGRPVLQQEFHDLDAVLLAGDVKGREAVQSSRVRIGFSIEEQLGDPDVAAVRGNVERGQVVDRHLVHRCAMIQQHSRSIHVVSLRGHVQGCEPILREKIILLFTLRQKYKSRKM